MRRKVIRAGRDRALPAFDARRQRPIDVLKGLLRGSIPRASDAVKDAARLRLLLGLVAEERVLQSHWRIGGIEAHGFLKLGAREFVLTYLQIGVSEILAN